MKDFDWRKKYAANGYAYIRKRLTFDVLERAYYPRILLRNVLEDMEHELARDCPYFYDLALAHTRISVWPKEVGESIDHLDPLRPRFGIEIEIRQPMPESLGENVSSESNV